MLPRDAVPLTLHPDHHFFSENSAGSLGIEGGAAVTSDVLALIDFYVDNGIIEKAEVEGEEDVYPVTAKQIGNTDEVCLVEWQAFFFGGGGC